MSDWADMKKCLAKARRQMTDVLDMTHGCEPDRENAALFCGPVMADIHKTIDEIGRTAARVEDGTK